MIISKVEEEPSPPGELMLRIHSGSLTAIVQLRSEDALVACASLGICLRQFTMSGSFERRQQILKEGLGKFAPNTRLRIHVSREQILGDGLQCLLRESRNQLIAKSHVEFLNEQGLDYGGLTKDFFSSLANRLFLYNEGLFCAAADATSVTSSKVPPSTVEIDLGFLPRSTPTSNWLSFPGLSLKQIYEGAGIVAAKAVVDSVLYG